MKAGDHIINYCSACYKSTNHTVTCVKEIPGTYDFQVYTYYSIVECKGCNYVSYLTKTEDYDLMSYDESENDYVPLKTFESYPEKLKYHHSSIESYRLPDKIRKAYKETITAFAAKCFLLTAVGFRVIIEAVCIDKDIKIKEFEELKPLIDKLHKKGFITKNEAARLHAVRFLGNDSVHEMITTKESDLLMVLDIVEHLLVNLYIIDLQLKEARLEMPINNFKELRVLLDSKITKLKIGDTLPLSKLLGRAARRLVDTEKALELESELILSIKNGDYKKLSIAQVSPHQDTSRTPVQYYAIESISIDDETYF